MGSRLQVLNQSVPLGLPGLTHESRDVVRHGLGVVLPELLELETCDLLQICQHLFGNHG